MYITKYADSRRAENKKISVLGRIGAKNPNHRLEIERHFCVDATNMCTNFIYTYIYWFRWIISLRSREIVLNLFIPNERRVEEKRIIYSIFILKLNGRFRCTIFVLCADEMRFHFELKTFSNGKRVEHSVLSAHWPHITLFIICITFAPNSNQTISLMPSHTKIQFVIFHIFCFRFPILMLLLLLMFRVVLECSVFYDKITT